MKYDKPGDIPQAVVNRMKKQKTYINMAERYAESKKIAVGDMSDDEWRNLYWEKSHARAKYYRKKKVEEVQQKAGEVASEPPAGDIGIEAYLEYYADPAPNDLVTLGQLVSMQRQLSQIEEQITDMLESGDINISRWRDLSRMQKELSTETRMLQDSLNISKKARDAMRQDRKVSDYVMENVAQSKALIEDYGIQIICPECLNRGVRLNQGFIINHFPEMGIRVTTRCPACTKEFTIERAPKKWERQVEVGR